MDCLAEWYNRRVSTLKEKSIKIIHHKQQKKIKIFGKGRESITPLSPVGVYQKV